MKYIVGLIILVGVIYITYNIFNFNFNDEIVNKYNTIIQTIYTMLTAILVYITYNALITQKHQDVRPYLVLSQRLNFENKNKLKFCVYNEGIGIALNVKIEIIRKKDNFKFFSRKYTRLGIRENNLRFYLESINYTLKNINETLKSLFGKPNREEEKEYVITENIIKDEVELKNDIRDYYNLKFIIKYNDIYGKSYVNTFDIKYNEEKQEFDDCIERFYEL